MAGPGTGQGAGQGGLSPDRHPTADFFICDLFDASPKGDLGSMEHPLFSLSTRPDLRVTRYRRGGTTVEVAPSVRGRATIHDKDILIYATSQLMAALNAGRPVAQRLGIKAHDLLVATNRDTSGDSYARLREAFERLAGTRITTNISTGGVETTSGFGLIESWEIQRRSRGGRMISVSVTLSDWLFRAVLAKSVLTLSRDYFRLRKPLERRLYELARKHCGRQPEWRASVATLHQKSGSTAPLRVFRAALRRIIADAHLPDYRLSEEPGDLIRVTRNGGARAAAGPRFDPEVLERARALAPGWDVHALESEWRAWWAETGHPRLTAPDRAFLGWIGARLARQTP
ncbi:replication initiator protein A [Frigidibacter sp. ROC022]|uniref:replication initiator protein A n=1 Tax=Frigidibacter sp. ROC022 TaxID=2971796 RepID=UPI00215A893B|nr:replication initiator protein A [Frigidibacter sp. ROC022]MCR8726821.1 replication initiator protein A [Frigidibacter sp. ROC022]